MSTPKTASEQEQRFGAQLAVYLLGLTIGGLYVGMISPVRTVIQADFGIGSDAGIWMINIYTLFYAALIPVIGRVADLHGRKRVFTACLAVFAAGAVLCGLSASFGGMTLLLTGRVVQAVGACGMIPVANAEMGTSFPEGKRGLALGLAAAITGMSNVLGAAVGSAVLGLFGSQNWPMLFYVCLPFCAVAMVGAILFLPHRQVSEQGSLDLPGSVVFVLMVLALLLGLREVDFFDLGSLAQPAVGGPLAAFAVLLVAFALIEKRSPSPMFHLEFLSNRGVVLTMLISFFIGGVVISMTLIPELAEATVGAPVGSGGYYVMAVGIFALFGPPLAGKIMDRIGPKLVLGFGLAVGAAGYVFLALVAVPAQSPALLVVGLCIMGLGMGFSMGAPCNYMVLEHTDDAHSTSAIATITLVRQLGTSIAPAILVGFTTAGAGLAGYQGMLACAAAFCLAGLALLAFYRSPRK
ncbi:MAG: MFS transporter [Coriobacteriia bacterium]|nr:MFS transporter [Coriobacteriia bacterium]